MEPRYIPEHEGRYAIASDEAVERIDENTIGVVAILGSTHTGEIEPIKAIHAGSLELISDAWRSRRSPSR